MSISQDPVEAQVHSIARSFLSETAAVSNSDKVCADLGISGSDAIIFIEDVEKLYGISLDDLIIDQDLPLVRPAWWQRLLGAREKPQGRDVTLGEVCDYIRRRLR